MLVLLAETTRSNQGQPEVRLAFDARSFARDTPVGFLFSY